jgi:hypothetical protein
VMSGSIAIPVLGKVAAVGMASVGMTMLSLAREARP